MEKKPMKIEDIRELCKEAHENAVRHGSGMRSTT